MAIQGKLVEQRPEEGTGEELYQKIQTEKQALIKSDKIKKDKPLPEIADDEKPFDIPESWKWVRWGEIVNIVSARRVHQSDWKSDGIPFYRAREIAKLAENGCVENELFISQDLFDEFSKSGVPQAGDLMVTAVGTLGKTYIVKSEDHFYYKDASVICFENFAGMLPEYLKYVMQSEMMKNQIKSNSDGTTVATLTMVRTVEYVLPLPPLDEQKRIRICSLFMTSGYCLNSFASYFMTKLLSFFTVRKGAPYDVFWGNFSCLCSCKQARKMVEFARINLYLSPCRLESISGHFWSERPKSLDMPCFSVFTKMSVSSSQDTKKPTWI